MNSKNIAVFGLWHLGSVTSACLAEMGHKVFGYDEDSHVVSGLKDDHAPLFEPGLDELIGKNCRAGRLSFSHAMKDLPSNAKLVFLSYDTPVDDNDQVNLSPLWLAIKNWADIIPKKQIPTLVIQSQVPVGFCDEVQSFFKKRKLEVNVVCLPENLRLGQAIQSFLEPDRLVVGTGKADVKNELQELFTPLKGELIFTDLRTAEMSKHATNAFLASSICFANEMGEICERIGADGIALSQILLKDRRFGGKLPLRPGLSFSGGTLARDLQILKKLGKKIDCPLSLLNGVIKSNLDHHDFLVQKVKDSLGPVKKSTVAVLGLTYKAGTSTLRRSLPMEIVKELIRSGAKVQAHDPKVDQSELPKLKRFEFFQDPYKSMKGADAILFLTDWAEFKSLDFNRALKLVSRPIVIDLRNFLENADLPKHGFTYVSVGRGNKDASRNHRN